MSHSLCKNSHIEIKFRTVLKQELSFHREGVPSGGDCDGSGGNKESSIPAESILSDLPNIEVDVTVE